jgi:hypothetical protein
MKHRLNIKKYLLSVDNPCVAAGKATEIFCGNMKMLLFEHEEYKGSIFGNYNTSKNLRAFMKKIRLKTDYGKVYGII